MNQGDPPTSDTLTCLLSCIYPTCSQDCGWKKICLHIQFTGYPNDKSWDGILIILYYFSQTDITLAITHTRICCIFGHPEDPALLQRPTVQEPWRNPYVKVTKLPKSLRLYDSDLNHLNNKSVKPHQRVYRIDQKLLGCVYCLIIWETEGTIVKVCSFLNFLFYIISWFGNSSLILCSSRPRTWRERRWGRCMSVVAGK